MRKLRFFSSFPLEIDFRAYKSPPSTGNAYTELYFTSNTSRKHGRNKAPHIYRHRWSSRRYPRPRTSCSFRRIDTRRLRFFCRGDLGGIVIISIIPISTAILQIIRGPADVTRQASIKILQTTSSEFFNNFHGAQRNNCIGLSATFEIVSARTAFIDEAAVFLTLNSLEHPKALQNGSCKVLIHHRLWKLRQHYLLRPI